MRDIKFRAWNDHDKKMYSPDWMGNGFWAAVSFKGELVRIDNHGHLHTLWGHAGDDSKRIAKRDIHLMQYTGLKDATGTDIYEGDIVTFVDGEWSYTAVVAWADYGWYMRGVEPVDNYSFEDCEPAAHEVIGNIYENPELLKAED